MYGWLNHTYKQTNKHTLRYTSLLLSLNYRYFFCCSILINYYTVIHLYTQIARRFNKNLKKKKNLTFQSNNLWLSPINHQKTINQSIQNKNSLYSNTEWVVISAFCFSLPTSVVQSFQSKNDWPINVWNEWRRQKNKVCIIQQWKKNTSRKMDRIGRGINLSIFFFTFLFPVLVVVALVVVVYVAG